MNTSELTVRQAELDRLLHDNAYLHGLPMEQSNILRREKETLDAFLVAQNQSQAANIPGPGNANVVQGIAAQPYNPDKEPGNMAAGAAARAAQRVAEAGLAPQKGNQAPAQAQAPTAPPTAQQGPQYSETPDALGQDTDTAVPAKAKAAPQKKAAVQKQAPAPKSVKVVSKKKA